jgi:hypothetical protein
MNESVLARIREERLIAMRFRDLSPGGSCLPGRSGFVFKNRGRR